MVFFRSFLGVAALAVTVAAVPVPRPDSSYSGSSSGYSSDNSNSGYSSGNSGYSNSNSGYSNSNSGYSNSNSGYNNNNNNNNYNNGYSSSDSSNYNTQYNNNNNYNTQSQQYTSTTTTQAYYTTTQAQLATSATTTTSQAYTTSYGSGSNNWGSSDYTDCVNQCLASFSAPSAMYTPSATTGSSSGQTGGQAGTNGVTHTVIVAPTQGVLRYVPFTVNASVGDTVQFQWNANNHTVTKSSELLLCNATSDAPFKSGEQNQGFVFNQVVNDTSPVFYYCGTPGHCEKGMFGIINPPSNFEAPTSIGSSMGNLVANSSVLAAAMTYTNNMTSGDARASTWGNNIDLAQLPSWSHEAVAENTLYTRAFLAANPAVYKDDGSIDLSGPSPLAIPADIASLTASTGATTPAADNASSNSPAGAPAAAASPAASSPAAKPKNAARGLAPSMFIAAVSVAVTFLAL